MSRYMAQRTLLEGLQIPIVNAGAEFYRGVLADQLLFEGLIKNDRLPLGADTPEIIAQHHHRGSFAHSDGAVCDRQSIHC